MSDLPTTVTQNGQYDFSNEEIATMFSSLLTGLADPQHQLLLNSDIFPKLIGQTGVWLDPNVPGDEHGAAEEFVGIGFVLKDTVDDDTRQPFVVAIKVHKPSLNKHPQIYTTQMVGGIAFGLEKMEKEMHETAVKNARKLRAQMSKGDVEAGRAG